MTDNFRWQVPGNGNIFDSKLEDWKNSNSKMSQRSIGVLEYIQKENIVPIEKFKNQIKPYLYKNFGHKINNSLTTHFYRPLEFAGLIRNFDGNLSVSIDGKNFLKEIKNENYDCAINYYLLQLMKTSYPNTATKDIFLTLFPFRIIFKLLLDHPIPLDWFCTKIPYIKTYDDLINIENLNNPPYQKWKTWVLSYLIKWGILEKKDDIIYLTNYKRNFLSKFLKHMKYKNMFFSGNEEYLIKLNNIGTKKRSRKIIEEALKEGEFKCFFNENHITFKTETKPNYVEGHHIIPISLDDSFSQELDSLDNVIPLCPTCHRAIHFAVNDKKEELLKIVLNNKKELKKYNVELEDLKEIYFNKKVKKMEV